MRNRVVRSALVGVLTGAAVLVAPAPSAAADALLTPVRTIGGPGHAELYAWGMGATPRGAVLVTDYWNARVVRYAPNGTRRATVIHDDGRHLAPYGVAADPRNGDVYIGDVDGNATIDKYTRDGRYLLSFGGRGTGAGRYQYPAYLAVASTGRVFVVDSRAHQVVAVSPSGRELFRIGGQGSAPGAFGNPRGIAVDAQDRIYVADNFNHRVQVFSHEGRFLWQFGREGTGPGTFGSGKNLRGLAVDARNGWVYVADATNAMISKFDLRGRFITRWGGFGTAEGRFTDGPRGVTVDRDGNVWVADMTNFRAQKFGPRGRFLLAVPDPPAPPPDGGFNQPTGVAVNSKGKVIGLDSFNWRVQRFSRGGAFEHAFGNRKLLNYPRGIAIDRRDDAIVVADTDNQVVKKFGRDGALRWRAAGKAWAVDVGSDGRIYVADSGQRRVRILGPGGNLLSSFGGNFGFPRGIAFDRSDGSIWVSDSQRGDVQRFSLGGSLRQRIGSRGTAPHQLAQAADVEVDARYVFVTDARANQIKVWTKSGQFVGAFGGGGSGLGRMRAPMGMDRSGRLLYVAERTGERIHVWRIGEL